MSDTLRSLYICYFPITEPLVKTQVVAYLQGLAARGHTIHLLTFETEPLTRAQRRSTQRELAQGGIRWHSLRYHKRPTLPATLFDTFCGVLLGLRLLRRYRLNAVHARSHVPAAIGLILKKLTGCRLIFDIRGLLAEEYVDAGNWTPDSLPFRITKWMERKCIAAADGIVVLTERVRDALFPAGDARVRVIPCCADLTQIENLAGEGAAKRAELHLDGKTVMVYVGKFGGWYMQAEMADFFAAARSVVPDLHFLVLTQSDPKLIENELAGRGLAPDAYTITRSPPEAIGGYLAASDFAISFIAACPSKIASSPTKLGEYLAAGLPVVCNPGVGDVDTILHRYCAGVMVSEFEPESYRQAARAMLALLADEAVRTRCHTAAAATASLQEIGLPRYDELYRAVAAKQ